MINLARHFPAQVRVPIGLIATIITFFYCISKTGSVVGVDLIPIYQSFITIEYDLPWGTAGIISVIVGVLTMTVGVGLAIFAGYLFILAFIIIGLYYGIDYFGGWG